MALALTMRDGHKVMIGASTYTVVDVLNGLEFSIIGPSGKFAINCNSWVEIADGVKVQAGIPRNVAGVLVRLVIDADRSINIFLVK